MKRKTSTKINGLGVENVKYDNAPASLPKFVREVASERGYGDATQTLSLFIQDGDVAEAFECAAHGNGSACVMAQAGKRIGAKSVYFYRTSAWIDFGYGPIVRFATSKAIYKNVIAPFDDGDREHVLPGIYHLTPFAPSMTLPACAERERRNRKNKKKSSDGDTTSRTPRIQAHTERVVMASRT